MQARRTTVVVNTAEMHARRLHPQCRFLAADRAAQARASRPPPAASARHFVDATRIATALLGDSIGANMFMVGYRLSARRAAAVGEAIEQAIELNGEAVAMNHRGVPLGPPRRSRPGRASRR